MRPPDVLYAFDATLHRMPDAPLPGPPHVDTWGTWPTLAAGIARAAGRNAGRPGDPEAVQTELAARWLSTDELDTLR